MAQPLQNVEIDPGIAADLLPLAAEHDPHRKAGIEQMAGDHVAVAAVVARSAEDADLGSATPASFC